MRYRHQRKHFLILVALQSLERQRVVWADLLSYELTLPSYPGLSLVKSRFELVIGHLTYRHMVMRDHFEINPTPYKRLFALAIQYLAVRPKKVTLS